MTILQDLVVYPLVATDFQRLLQVVTKGNKSLHHIIMFIEFDWVNQNSYWVYH